MGGVSVWGLAGSTVNKENIKVLFTLVNLLYQEAFFPKTAGKLCDWNTSHERYLQLNR